MNQVGCSRIGDFAQSTAFNGILLGLKRAHAEEFPFSQYGKEETSPYTTEEFHSVQESMAKRTDSTGPDHPPLIQNETSKYQNGTSKGQNETTINLEHLS